MNRSADCCCGKSRIEVNGEPEINAVCHCSNCQKRTGSAFGISLYFSEDNVVTISNTMRTYIVDAESGPQERNFCLDCGTTLYWKSSQFPNMIGIAGGCFKDEIPDPNISASDSNRKNWVDIPKEWKVV